MSNQPAALLVGPLSVDRYLDLGEDLPGGGILNMAYHWAQKELAFEVISRVAPAQADVFEDFFARHSIFTTPSLVTDGVACTVDVRFGDDRQPVMDSFVPGVLDDVRFDDDEIDRIRSGIPTHFVLVDVMDVELHRVAAVGSMPGARLTGDFLSFRHFTPARFEATMRYLDVGFIGWPGDVDDPIVDELARVAESIGNVLVVTFGSRGVQVVDGRHGRRGKQWFDVEAQPVVGTTVGCGDAFIAAFLAGWFDGADVAQCVDAGRALGATATTWERPLPDRAYA